MIPFTQRIDGTILALAVLLVVAVRVAMAEDKSTLQLKLFKLLLALAAAQLVLDTFTLILDGKAGVGAWLNVIYVLYFTFQPLVTYLWALYADYQAFFDEGRLKRLALALSPPIILHTMMAIATPSTGWIFVFDAANVYSRGRLFFASAVIPFLYIAYTFVSALAHWGRISSRNRFAILFFAVPPAIGGAVQAFYYGVNLLWPGVALSILMIYLTIESELLSTDHLTGLQNRRSFDKQLARRVKGLPSDRTMALVMLDLDGFKGINDAYGHSVGDEALVEAAGVLKRCLHADDFIARYAGDEFVVLAELRRPDDAAALLARMGRAFEAFNEGGARPWRLVASMGAACKGPGDQASPAELLAEADAAMYKAKAGSKAAR